MSKKHKHKKDQEEKIESPIDLENENIGVPEETSADKLEECQDKLKELENEVGKLQDELLREKAEFENMKKRLEKEKIQAMAYASEQFARDLLAVIDTLELASESAKTEGESSELLSKISEGIELTIEQMKKVYSKHGIELISVENGFDPNFHNAVMQVESDEHESGQIVQILQKGYTMKDRVLRPAMVSVAK